MKHLIVCTLAISYLFANNILASNNISEIVFSENNGKAVIKVVGTQKPTFTVFKLREPLRLIVDISNASMKGIESPINIDNSVIKQIITSQFEDDVNKTSRLMLSLKKDAKYSVNSIGNSFYLSIENPAMVGSKKIVRKNKNIDYLNKREKELDRKRNNLSQKEEELSQKEEMLTQKRNDLHQREAELAKKEEEILKLKTYIDGIRNKENQNNKVLTSLNKKNIENQNKLSNLKHENESLYSRIEELEKLNKSANDRKLKNEILVLKKKKNNINSKLIKLNKEKNSILVKHQKLSRDKKLLLKEKRNYNKKLLALKKENKKLRSNLSMISSNTNKSTNLKDIKVLQYKDKIVFRLSMKDYNGDFEIFELNKPKRIVLEIPNTKMNKNLNSKKSFDNNFLKSIRLSQKDKKVNFIVDISDKASMPRYFLKKDNDLLLLTVLTKNNKKLDNLLDINSSLVSDNLNLVLKFDSNVKYSLIREDDDLAVIKFYNVKTPQVLQNTIDLSKKNLNVKMASVFQSENNTILAVKLKKKTNNNIVFDKGSNVFTWKFDNKKDKFEYTRAETASYANDTPSRIKFKKKYKGKRISLDFKNADIHDVLSLIADVSKINIITSDEVSGTVTIRLRNVQWDKALDIILKTKGLGQERLGNIIRVATSEVLQKEFQDEIDRKNKLKDNDPLEVLLLPVSYARAEELVEQVKGILSKRGNVSVDIRTNTLVIKDIEEKLEGVKELVRNLDTQTPQVLIEGRIVEASSNFSRNQGVQWGGNLDADSNKGSGFGVYFPSRAGISGYTSDGNNGSWVTDLPAKDTFGGLNFSVGSIADSIGLRLRLTAAESQGEVKFISSPRISTLDNKEATIETGMKIPITVLNAQGIPTSKLIDAKIKLTVVPHVTSDNSIILKVNMVKEEPDFSKTNRLGDPAILSKNASTELLVKNGNTAVIGGMFSKTLSHGEKRVPLLGKIPILGWFFKSTSHKDERSELLIFITPRIINRN